MQSYFSDDIKLEDVFNQSLVDCLPGTFYIYEIEGNIAKMKMWNIFHEQIFGYTSEECFDKPPLFYVDPAYAHVINNAILEVMKAGYAKQVVANIITKAGKSIPFVFEGYKFQMGNKTYFTGTGLDISDLVSAKEQVQLLELEKEKVAKEKLKKEKQLLTLALQENKNSFLLNKITQKLQEILKSKDLKFIDIETRKLLSSLLFQEKTKNNWEQFKELFINVHRDFFTKLKGTHPDLTNSEVRFCSYIKINMSSSDLCIALNISKDGLKKKRYRLKKKLHLENKVSIKEYLNSI
jgi:PAS domain S-box-containing protein